MSSKWEPVEVEEAEYHAVWNSLEKKAMELAGEAGHRGKTLFLSRIYFPCVYKEDKVPRTFKQREKNEVWNLVHFLPFTCDCERAMMSSGEEAICLARTINKYFLHTHKIGKCPWKTV